MRWRSGWPRSIVEPARHLDRALERLGAGVAEEHRVGERMRDQALGQLLLGLDAVEIGAVPELLGLRLEHRHQVRMGVAEQRDRDAAAEVEIAAPGAIEQIGALAALEGDRGPLVNRQQRRHGSVGHGGWSRRWGLKEHHRCIVPACQRLAPVPARAPQQYLDVRPRAGTHLRQAGLTQPRSASTTREARLDVAAARSPASWVANYSGVDLDRQLNNSGNPVASCSVDGVSLCWACLPAPLDTGAEPQTAIMAKLSELHRWSGGVMRLRHPPGSWLTRNRPVPSWSSTSLNQGDHEPGGKRGQDRIASCAMCSMMLFVTSLGRAFGTGPRGAAVRRPPRRRCRSRHARSPTARPGRPLRRRHAPRPSLLSDRSGR